MKNQLDDLRKDIDLIDSQIVSLLGKRLSIVKEIGKLKLQKHLPPLDPLRWRKVLDAIVKKGKELKIDEDLLKKIYEEIHKDSLKIEKSL